MFGFFYLWAKQAFAGGVCITLITRKVIVAGFKTIADFIRRLRRKDENGDESKLRKSDRGHVRYFHGRKEILTNFSGELCSAIAKDSRENGTVFLVQGSPGAGKTALLNQFIDMARAGGDAVGGKKWRILEIGKTALYDPASLMNDAGEIYKMRETTEWSGHAEVSVPEIAGAEGARKTLTSWPLLTYQSFWRNWLMTSHFYWCWMRCRPWDDALIQTRQTSWRIHWDASITENWRST